MQQFWNESFLFFWIDLFLKVKPCIHHTHCYMSCNMEVVRHVEDVSLHVLLALAS